MGKSITLLANAVTGAVYNATNEDKQVVQQILSYHVYGYEKTTSYIMGSWDGTSSFFRWSNSTFPAGFLYYLAANLKRRGYEINIVKKPLPPPLGKEHPVVGKYKEDPRYDYQYTTVDRLLKYGQIIAQCATGSGKTHIAELAFARINRPTLFITTRSILMYQMKERFEEDFGIPVSVIGDGEFGLEGNRSKLGMFTVAMVQTLYSRLSGADAHDRGEKRILKEKIKRETEELLKKFEFIILEEAHESSSNSYFDICNHCKNAFYRLALTATPFMKENEESNMRLMAVSGAIGIKVTEKLLIDRGILARPYFKFIELQHRPKYLTRRTPWQAAYRLGIVENEERNRLIVQEAVRAVKHGLSVMCLANQINHGKILKKLMKENGLRVDFIYGADDAKERSVALNRLKNREIDVLIGSTILDVGVDVPAVGMVILAGAGKTQVAIRQRIGRGLRAKKTGANVCFIVDFNDPFNIYLSNHANLRRRIIEKTDGFNEGIVSDFCYDNI